MSAPRLALLNGSPDNNKVSSIQLSTTPPHTRRPPFLRLLSLQFPEFHIISVQFLLNSQSLLKLWPSFIPLDMLQLLCTVCTNLYGRLFYSSVTIKQIIQHMHCQAHFTFILLLLTEPDVDSITCCNLCYWFAVCVLVSPTLQSWLKYQSDRLICRSSDFPLVPL